MIDIGIRAMDRSEAAESLKVWRGADERRHAEEKAKHDATLEALRALIERTSPA